jgi:ribosomal protein S8
LRKDEDKIIISQSVNVSKSEFRLSYYPPSTLKPVKSNLNLACISGHSALLDDTINTFGKG